MNLEPHRREVWDEWLRACIHCGLCLNDCPTYRLDGDELDSPRGRIVQMRDLLAPLEASSLRAGEIDRGALDRCLGCLACATVCPSGVPYASLLAQTRETLGPSPEPRGRLLAWVVDQLMPRPRWLAVFSALGQWAGRGPLRFLLPSALRELTASLPRRAAKWPRRPAAAGEDAGTVAVLVGCAQTVYTPEVLPATLRLLRAAGERPTLPEGQGCCGALSHHQGSVERARELARRNVDAFAHAREVVVPSAGCSAHMRHYGELLADDPAYAERAKALAAKTVDLVVWLHQNADRLEFREDVRRVAYHPPCHHTHAQGLGDEAQQVLDRVPGLTRTAIPRATSCCGSAGAYSLQHPEMAKGVREAKIHDLLADSPALVLTANPGCELFLDAGLAERGSAPPLQHLAVYLEQRLAEDAGIFPSEPPKR